MHQIVYWIALSFMWRNVYSLSSVSHSCTITSKSRVAESDILALDISFPLLVLPPLKEVTYFSHNSSSKAPSAVLPSLASEVDITITTTIFTDDEGTQHLTRTAFENFCGAQHVREILPSSTKHHTTDIRTIHVKFSSSRASLHSSEEYTLDFTSSSLAAAAHDNDDDDDDDDNDSNER